jgi:alpha-D-xyloside xylohydrolase
LEELLKVKIPMSGVTSTLQGKSASESKAWMHTIHTLGAHVLTQPTTLPAVLDTSASKDQFWKVNCVPVLKSGAEGWLVNPQGASTRSLVQTIFEAQTLGLPDRRAIQLVQSDTTGLQSYAAVPSSTHDGDSWSDLQRQVLAGLSHSLTGNPNWLYDAGTDSKRVSSFMPPNETEELAIRRLDLIPFVPLTGISEAVAQSLLSSSDLYPVLESLQTNVALRERLRPYIYSLAGSARFQHGTITRPLSMDFPEDPKVSKSIDQYMFGPDFLITPITQSDIRKRMVHLPTTDGGWYDFWSEKLHEGGMDEIVTTPKHQIPVFIRAGSILPTSGPSKDGMTLTIYTGANGKFMLYSDDGQSTGYRKGEFEMIPVSWDDVKQTLVLGQRKGSYKAMPLMREFAVIFVDATGRSKVTPVKYTGEPTTLRRQMLQ